uniref:asparagine synthase (glutamine-hydrolyzing) n=1 Tax=viral metagenome TaxID=1070528 RepID=A0A6C0M2V3_9ZZZZ
MCGIFYYEAVGSTKRIPMSTLHQLQSNFAKISHRGPDNSRFIVDGQRCLGFHRLAINGLASTGDQPFRMLNCELICNGEIYNHRKLVAKYGFTCASESDCEVVIHLYRLFGGDMCATLRELDGVFSLVLIDRERDLVHVARDPFGVRSLYYGRSPGDFSVASEMKALQHCEHVEQFPGGCYMTVSKLTQANNQSRFDTQLQSYYPDLHLDETQDVPRHIYNFGTALLHDDVNASPDQLETRACVLVRNLFELAVCKRLMSERPVGCLLSGGLDSSIVTALVVKFMAQAQQAEQQQPVVDTYAIGLEGSVDLKWARRVSEYLGTRHHEVCLTEQQFLDAIDATIYQIESYDTTTVRASVGNYLVSKYIYDNTDNVVIFCGDMSDEIFGSYRGFTKAPSDHEFARENVRMVRDVRCFDLLRSDKSISGAGLEARVPFADKTFLEFVMSLPPWMKRFGEGADYAVEKHLLRKAFGSLLPEDVMWRRKEAFSDGVSGHERTWVQIIKEYVDQRVSDVEISVAAELNKYEHNAPYDKESYYYRTVFERHFPGKGRAETIPYFWRHPFCEGVLDPSARLLKDVYAASNQS